MLCLAYNFGLKVEVGLLLELLSCVPLVQYIVCSQQLIVRVEWDVAVC